MILLHLTRLPEIVLARTVRGEYIRSDEPGPPVVASATEPARVRPAHSRALAHDSFARLFHRLEPNPGPVIDSTLDKPRAKHIGLVADYGSGNHNTVVRGINLITALWSDGDRHYPCDYRIVHKETDAKTRNNHRPRGQTWPTPPTASD